MALETCRNCAIEGTASKPLLRCSRCKAVYYCSQDCQKADIRRHRRDDDCGGKAAVSATQAFAAPPASEAALRAANSATSSKAAERQRDVQVEGPPCLRCRAPAGKAADQIYVSVAQKSIFQQECEHGPYCSKCAGRMQMHTLPFCHGCSALVDYFESPGQRSSCATGVTAASAATVDGETAANAAGAAVAEAAATLPGVVSLGNVD